MRDERGRGRRERKRESSSNNIEPMASRS